MSQPPQPVWEKRPNMGASPIAIYTAKEIRELREREGDELQPITHAALIDAAFRRAGVPELHKALENLLWAINTSKRPVPLEPALATAVLDARTALNHAERELDLAEPHRRHYRGEAP